MMKYSLLLSFLWGGLAFAEPQPKLDTASDFGHEFAKILSGEPTEETKEILAAIGLAELKKIVSDEPTEETKEILAAIGAAKLQKVLSPKDKESSASLAAPIASVEIKEEPKEAPLSKITEPAIDIETVFKKALSAEKNKQSTSQAILAMADTHIAESNYGAALDLLGDNPDGTAQWYEVYGSAALGDRQQAKALEAFTHAQKIYEEQGKSDKVNQMNAMINALTPREK